MDLIFYITTACLVMLFGSLNTNIDFDFWARLVVGKSFFQTGTLFNYEFQSYGTTHQFIDHEWGSSLVFFLVQNYFGDIGLFLFKSTIIFLTIFLITKIIKLDKNNTKLHFLFFFITLQSISYNIFDTIRCQCFSFLFFVLYLYILKKSKSNPKILWTIPALNIIWANMHGGFAIGLVLVAIYTLGEFLNKRDFKPYVIVFITACLTSLINPYGIKYIYFILEALSLNRKYITEWQSAFFANMFVFSYLKFKIFFISVIIFSTLSIFRNIKKQGIKNFYLNIDKTKYLILIFTALISIKSVRFHVFFTYAFMALCYSDFYNIFNKRLPEKIDNIKEIVLCILIFISTISHLYYYGFINKVMSHEYPIFCIEFLRINNLKGNLLTNFHFGSYAAYKLYPNIQVYMDGRYEEVYDVELINKMRDVFTNKNNDLLREFHTDYIIIDNRYELCEKLKHSSDWFVALESPYYTLFLPSKLKNIKFKLPNQDPNYYNAEKFKTQINWR